MARLLTVRNRTTAVAAVVVGVALTMGAIGLVGSLRTRLLAAQRSAATLRAQAVAGVVEAGSLPADLSFPGDDDGFTQVVDSTGRVVSATEDLAHAPPISSMRPDKGDTADEIIPGSAFDEGGRFMVVATTVDSDHHPMTVIAAEPLADTDDTVRAMSLALGAGVPVLVVLVALVTRTLVGRALRPVERMRKRAAGITDDALDVRLPTPGTGDEIDALAATLNEMLDRLDAASRRQRRFVADASHELRSPLASARTALEVAVTHPDTVDAQAAMRSALLDQARLEQLVGDLLTIARLGDHSIRRHQVFDLRSVIDEEVSAISDDRVSVAGTGPANLDGDVRAVARVVRNLLDNALRHAREQVLVSVGPREGRVQLVVDDDGEGVPQAERERIFDRFTRLDSARARDAGGSGLGLSIVRDVVNDMGGHVTVGDSPLGGARFEVDLPASADAPTRS